MNLTDSHVGTLYMYSTCLSCKYSPVNSFEEYMSSTAVPE